MFSPPSGEGQNQRGELPGSIQRLGSRGSLVELDDIYQQCLQIITEFGYTLV